MLGMKTQCMRTKSSTAGSGRERKKTESRGKSNGKRKEVRGSEREVPLYLTRQVCAVVIFYLNLLPGSLGCMSILIVSRKCSRIFSGVPDITVYLQETRNRLKGAVRGII